MYAYVGNDPINRTDPSGEIPLLVILPAIGGTVSGGFAAFDAYSNGGGVSEVAGAFGRGFVSGASGTLAGIGIGVATGNPFAAGAAGGAVSSIVDQGISGKFNPDNFLVSTMTGAIAGPLASKLLPTVGRLPNLLTPRNAENFGKNSMRLTGQEILSETVGGVTGSVTSGK